MDKNIQIEILDTTLRDGQQSPGSGMSFEDNIIYSEIANSLNIDILEAGFPAASKLDFDIVKTITDNYFKTNSKTKVAALSQMREKQVAISMSALESLKNRNQSRVHVYIPVDPILAQASLKNNNKSKNIEQTFRLIKFATTEGFEVQFSAEGYSKLNHNFDYVSDLFIAAVEAGASILNCPDTIGGSSVHENGIYFVKNINRHNHIIKSLFPKKEITWSVHCHNDLGLALTNSINAVDSGIIGQVEGCINGVGERAGNMAIEQFALYLHKFGKNMHKIFYTDINMSYIKKASDFISDKMLVRQDNHPIVGNNAAKHSSGGHTNAIIKNPNAYQPFDPKLVGKDISFIFGPLSGGNLLKDILEKYGIFCSDQYKSDIAQMIKDKYKHRRKGISDIELVKAYKEIISPLRIENFSATKKKSSFKLDYSFLGTRKVQYIIDKNIYYDDYENLKEIFVKNKNIQLEQQVILASILEQIDYISMNNMTKKKDLHERLNYLTTQFNYLYLKHKINEGNYK